MPIQSVMPSTISSPVVPFSSCPQPLPASGSSPMSQLFTWGGQSIGVLSIHVVKNVFKYSRINDSDFPDSSVCKEPACNAGDSSSIPGLGRSTREGIGYPLQYSWASLVAQLVKNTPTIQKTWVGKIPWRRERLPLKYSGLENSMHFELQRFRHDWVTFNKINDSIKFTFYFPELIPF